MLKRKYINKKPVSDMSEPWLKPGVKKLRHQEIPTLYIKFNEYQPFRSKSSIKEDPLVKTWLLLADK